MNATMAENEASDWVSHINVIIPNPENNAILLLSTVDGWRLPYVRADGGIWLAETSQVAAALREQLGLYVAFTILRYAQIVVNKQERWDEFIYVLELHEPLSVRPLDHPFDPLLGGQWVDQRMLSGLRLAQPEQHACVSNYLHEVQVGKVPQRRTPWAQPGWFSNAIAWIEATLAEQGINQTGPVEQLRSWSISTILRVPSSTGFFYFKAVADLPLFVNEPAMLLTLAQLFPANVPMPVHIDSQRRWLLMQDFGPSLREQGVVDKAPPFSAYGKLQQATAEHLDALRAAGCLDRRLPVLAEQIDPLLADPTTQATVSEPDLTALVALAPRLKAACAELAEYKIPNTLVHGDLHLGNIALRNGNYLFFDWTDACISHPFLDMIEIYFYEPDEVEQKRLCDSYLALWTKYASPEQLRYTWDLAKPLCALHQAVSYLHIVNNVEPLVREDLLDGLPGFLKRVLA